MRMSNRSQDRLKRLRQLWNENEWIYLIVGIMIGLLVIPAFNVVTGDFEAFLENLVPEAVGIIFTVVIIDRLDLIREDRLIREQLVRKVHSRDNQTALQAVEELRVLGYLSDGSLVNKELRGSHWQDANLYQANLQGSDLINTIMRNADLYEANLKDANVLDEQLASAQAMRGAIMPDGSRYDGRYNLYHDFEVMERKGFDITNPQSVAEYYGVPIDVYLKGQEWANENMDFLAKHAYKHAESVV